LATAISTLYIDAIEFSITGASMALQIANPSVVSKVERLAKRTGLSKTAVVERAVDRLLSETADPSTQAARLAALLAQLDRIPDRRDASDPMSWDDHGLPT
jgi:antitoxin VapB